jgi:hypothetical protein
MAKHKPKPWFAIIASAVILVLPSTAFAGKTMSKKRFTETMVKVRTGANSTVRNEAAQHLAELTRGIDPNEIDDRTISDLVSLLDVPEARYWVAVCLGNLGPRAKIAVPRLQELLAEEDCLQVSKSAAGGIRFALARMGVKTSTPKCGTRN